MNLDDVIFAREARALGADRELSRRFVRGEYRRIAPGAYAPVAAWQALDPDEKYRLRVAAVSSLHSDLQMSHASAAVVWEIESLRPWPTTVHARTVRAAGGRSNSTVTRHTIGLDPAGLQLDGIAVTSLQRTALDLASNRHFTAAVVQLDAILNCRRREPDIAVTPQALDAAARADPRLFAPARTLRALAFADARAQSVGESVSRVQLHALGAPPPELQVEFADRDGDIGSVDFFWPELGIVGEFDGKVKYGTARKYRHDLTPEALLMREKRREDRIRRQVQGFIRWDWATARDRRRLAALLLDHGIPLRTR